MTAKIQISVTLDKDVLVEIDQIAEIRGESRASVVNRTLRNGLPKEREFLEVAANPLISKLLENGAFLKGIAALVGEHISDEEAATTRKVAQSSRAAKSGARKAKEKPA